MKGKYESIPKKYSKDLADIVHSCLMKDYNKRPSIDEIILLPVFQQKAFLLKIKIPLKRQEEQVVVQIPEPKNSNKLENQPSTLPLLLVPKNQL